MLKHTTYLISGLVYSATAFFVFLVILLTQYDTHTLIFLMGSICALSYIAWQRSKHNITALATRDEKITIGILFANFTLIVGLALQLLFHPFEYPEITIGIAIIGSFIFPFIILNTFVKAFNKDLQKKSNQI